MSGGNTCETLIGALLPLVLPISVVHDHASEVAIRVVVIAVVRQLDCGPRAKCSRRVLHATVLLQFYFEHHCLLRLLKIGITCHACAVAALGNQSQTFAMWYQSLWAVPCVPGRSLRNRACPCQLDVVTALLGNNVTLQTAVMSPCSYVSLHVLCAAMEGGETGPDGRSMSFHKQCCTVLLALDGLLRSV